MFWQRTIWNDLFLPLFPFVRGEVLPQFFTVSSGSLFHPPLSIVFFFFQSSSSPAFPTSILTESSHLSIGLPRLILPYSHNSAALFGSLSSAILSTCPAHCGLLLTSLSVKLLCTPVSSLNSTILLLYDLVTLDIFHSQLLSLTCSLCCCSSVIANVSVPNKHASVTQVLTTLPFSLFEILRSAIIPQLLSTRSLRPVLFAILLSPSSRLRTLPLLDTRKCPPDSVSAPPARCPALTSGGLCAALPSSLG